MSGYLGGNFKPDEGVTMRDAIKAVLGVLGYTNEDFSGSLQESRLAKFKSLSLDSGIYRDLDEVLTREGLHQPVLQPDEGENKRRKPVRQQGL